MNAVRNRRIRNMAALAAAGLMAVAGLASAQAAKGQPTPVQARPQQSADAVPQRLFAAWDKDHNGVLSQQEFVAGWSGARQRIVTAEHRLQQQFKVADANHDGGIDAAEYAGLQVVRNAGGKAPPFATFDANHDQRLAPGEYVAMLRRFGAARARGAAAAPAPAASAGKR
jgi:Ca2+-binding EF-hand superfamily protein